MEKYFFFFNDTATTEIYTLSLHDALPICSPGTFRWAGAASTFFWIDPRADLVAMVWTDRKSTRLNSSHGYISYAVFCLKKKKKVSIHSRRRNGTRLRESIA